VHRLQAVRSVTKAEIEDGDRDLANHTYDRLSDEDRHAVDSLTHNQDAKYLKGERFVFAGPSDTR